MRLLHGLLSRLKVPNRWARWMVLRAAWRLMLVGYVLFEVVQTLPMPSDLDEMRDLMLAQ